MDPDRMHDMPGDRHEAHSRGPRGIHRLLLQRPGSDAARRRPPLPPSPERRLASFSGRGVRETSQILAGYPQIRPFLRETSHFAGRLPQCSAPRGPNAGPVGAKTAFFAPTLQYFGPLGAPGRKIRRERPRRRDQPKPRTRRADAASPDSPAKRFTQIMHIFV